MRNLTNWKKKNFRLTTVRKLRRCFDPRRSQNKLAGRFDPGGPVIGPRATRPAYPSYVRRNLNIFIHFQNTECASISPKFVEHCSFSIEVVRLNCNYFRRKLFIFKWKMRLDFTYFRQEWSIFKDFHFHFGLSASSEGVYKYPPAAMCCVSERPWGGRAS